MFYSIFPVYNGSFTVTLSSSNAFSAINNIPSFFFLLLDEQGEAIVVDTGFSAEHLPGPRSTFERDTENELIQALSRFNISPEQVSTVIQTHLHWDHTGGMPLFTQASFFLQAEELRGLLRLDPREEIAFCAKHWLNLLPRFILVQGQQEIRPGLRTILTGRHTPGHQVVEVNTRKGKVILGGDAPFIYDRMWQAIPDNAWQAFRNGPGADYYWQEDVRPTLEKFLRKAGVLHQDPPPPVRLAGLRQDNQFVLSHDPGLKEVALLS